MLQKDYPKRLGKYSSDADSLQPYTLLLKGKHFLNYTSSSFSSCPPASCTENKVSNQG